MRLSQADFAAAIDATPQAVASWETGTREPRSVVAIAKRIELAFNVPAAWVLGLETGTAGPTPDPGGTNLTGGYRASVLAFGHAA